MDKETKFYVIKAAVDAARHAVEATHDSLVGANDAKTSALLVARAAIAADKALDGDDPRSRELIALIERNLSGLRTSIADAKAGIAELASIA